MPHFSTRDGRDVHFESNRDPIVPVAHKVGAWAATRWLPALVLVVNVLLISSSRWGAMITSLAVFVLVKLGYRALRSAAGEAAGWASDLGKIDRYRAQGRSLMTAGVEPQGPQIGDKVAR